MSGVRHQYSKNFYISVLETWKNKSWNQRELPKRVDLNPSVMNRLESGERPIKDYELGKIATVLDVTTDYLLGRSANPEMTEEEFEAFKNDPDLERWYKSFLKIMKKIFEDYVKFGKHLMKMTTSIQHIN
ncbi:helix-turn-helix transcriptional regulator [Bacillaceae bacterium S4-13-56]